MLRLDPRGTHHLDERHPFVDALLADGERLHVIGPPIGRFHKVNIRKSVGLPDPCVSRLMDNGTFGSDSETAAKAGRFVLGCWQSEQSFLIVGPQGSGKTTIQRAVIATAGALAAGPAGADEYEHVVVLEEAREIDPLEELAANIDCLACRPSDDRAMEVSMERLVKEAKRSFAQRLVVGEVRDSQVSLDAMSAAREGVPFSGTLHAESAAEGVGKFAYLMMLSGKVGAEVANAGIAGALDVIVVCERVRVWNDLDKTWERRPRVTEIATVTGDLGPGGDVVLRRVFTYDHRSDCLVGVGNVAFAERQQRRFERHDIDVHGLLVDPPILDVASGAVHIPTLAVPVGGGRPEAQWQEGPRP